MSNVEGTPSVAETIAGQQAGIAAPVVGDTVDKARYDQEIANHVRERNLYKPAQQLLSQLDAGSADAVTRLIAAVVAGDTDAIVQWNIEAMEASSGKSAADIIAARQQAANAPAAAPAAVPAAVPGMTAEQVAELVQQTIRQNANESAVRAEMQAAGYPLGTPRGDTIIRYCVNAKVDVAAGVAWFEADAGAPVAPGAAAAAVAAGTALPGTAPAGAAAATTPTENMTDRQRAEYRMKNWGNS